MGLRIEDIKQAHENAGYHFFQLSSMRFFRSRVGQNVYGVWWPNTSKRGIQTYYSRLRMGGQYFVTSEQFDYASPRLYTVRRYNPVDHTVDTIGEFQQYASRSGANAAAKRYRDREQETGEWEGKPEDADRNTRVDGGRLA